MEFFKTEIGRIILMVSIVLLSLLLSWLVKKFMRFLFKKTYGNHHPNAGNFLLFSTLVRFAIVLFGVSYAISFVPSIKSMSASLLASAGIATAIIGFAAKDVLANFVSGITIILFRPFTITDWIKVGEDHEGYVEEILMLHTVITDISNRRMIVPNSKIVSSFVINSSYKDTRICQFVKFNISYDSNIDKAKEIIRKAAQEHSLCIDNRTDAAKKNNDPVVKVLVKALAEYSIVLRASVWVKNPKDAIKVQWALNEEVIKSFRKEGIEVPMPYRNVVFKNANELPYFPEESKD